MAQITNRAEIVNKLCELLMDNKKSEGVKFAIENYPFVEIDKLHSRQYTKYEMMNTYLRDGFIDRYSGERLLFPGLIRLLTLEIPDIFKYHLNWKMSETHNIYWDLFPTIDHIVPIARGGTNTEDNWITTNQLRNSAKSNFTIEELGWEILPKGKLEDWDGLCSLFLKWASDPNLVEKHKDTEDWRYILGWYDALIQVQNNNSNSTTRNNTKTVPKTTTNSRLQIAQMDVTQTSQINIRELCAGCLYKTSNSSKTIYLVLSPYDSKSNSIATAVINNPNANPANIICRLRTEGQNNATVLQIIDYPQTPAQIIASLSPAQQFKVRQLYRGKM